MKGHLMKRVLLTGAIVVIYAAVASGAALIVNEYNAVSSSEFLGGDDPCRPETKVDTFFGRVQGNGGNWLELVVIEDHLDIRGWEIRYAQDSGNSTGIALWDPLRPSWVQGIIRFEPKAFWADMRAGTIITISEQDILETEDHNGVPRTFDLRTHTGFEPLNGDWWIHISTQDEQSKSEVVRLMTTLTTAEGDGPGDFSVHQKDWEVRIRDLNNDCFGPIGESISGWTEGSVKKDEAVRLEEDPDDVIEISDYDDVDDTTFGAPNVWGDKEQDFRVLRGYHRADLDANGVVDLDDFAVLTKAWMSERGDPNWNRRCDLAPASDNEIDEDDLQTFLAMWLAKKGPLDY